MYIPDEISEPLRKNFDINDLSILYLYVLPRDIDSAMLTWSLKYLLTVFIGAGVLVGVVDITFGIRVIYYILYNTKFLFNLIIIG
jgi:hypothetical protein